MTAEPVVTLSPVRSQAKAMSIMDYKLSGGAGASSHAQFALMCDHADCKGRPVSIQIAPLAQAAREAHAATHGARIPDA